MSHSRQSGRIVLSSSISFAIDSYAGSGTPVLLLHGIPGSRRTWREVAASLSPAHRVLVPDLLGFGESSDPVSDFHAPGQAAALHDLIDRLGVSDVHLAGFDFGGPIALALYRRIPARVRSLTLAATNAFPDTPIPGPLKLARVPVAGEALFRVMCSAPGLAAMWVGAVGDKQALPFMRYWRALPSRRARAWTRRVFLDSLRHLRARYTCAQHTLAEVTCPSVVLWGDRDPFFPIGVGQRTATAMRHAELLVFTGCGHFVPEERPRDSAAAMLDVISRAEPGRRSPTAGDATRRPLPAPFAESGAARRDRERCRSEGRVAAG